MGYLPPRGPPKAGVNGPNKNVNKLQVLLCGNEYIKIMKARVERRDEEIGKLRWEIKKLLRIRWWWWWYGGDDCEGGEEIDLDKDLDAVEKLNVIGAAATRWKKTTTMEMIEHISIDELFFFFRSLRM